MGFFHFDESLHPKAGFALGAFVYSEESLDTAVCEALHQSGLTPKVDEFKSGMRMDMHPKQARARDLLKSILGERCGVGVVVVPYSPRDLLGPESLLGLNKILTTISFRSKSHDVYFDQGIFPSGTAGRKAADSISFAQRCRFYFEQDSRQVLGLQIADLVAHMCGTMLLAQLGLVKKTVKAGPDSGYDPDGDMPLGFELRATLRRRFFAAPPPPVDTWKSQLDYQVDVESRGLHIAPSCDAKLARSALSRFGKMYLGCIH
jgi:hypothetical protein